MHKKWQFIFDDDNDVPCDKKCSFGRQTGFIFIQAATFTFEGEVDMHVVPFHTIE